jgi:hypothetical protein
MNKHIDPIFAIAILMTAVACLPAGARSRVTYVPAITLLPTVVQADGQPRVYTNGGQAAYWNETLPIERGDQIKLNVAVATGGADLGRVIVRLDNSKVADMDGTSGANAAPWTTVIDTSKLETGDHMVEAWAQTTGDRPQSSTKTLTFMIVDSLPVQVSVAGSREESFSPGAAPPVAPPAFLSGAGSDPGATVRLRSVDPGADRALNAHDSALSITAPTPVWVEKRPGSTAVQFAYEIVRGGFPIVSAPAPATLVYERLSLQPRGSENDGLAPGAVTLYVWGIDSAGRISDPVRQDLSIGDSEAAR